MHDLLIKFTLLPPTEHTCPHTLYMHEVAIKENICSSRKLKFTAKIIKAPTKKKTPKLFEKW